MAEYIYINLEKDKEIKKSLYSDLMPGDIVLFYVDPQRTGQRDIYCGNIINISERNHSAWISYLEGYKDRGDKIPFIDIISKYDEDGTILKIGPYTGKSVLLWEG